MLVLTSFSVSKDVVSAPRPHGISNMIFPAWLARDVSPAVTAQGTVVYALIE